jgi:citrate lyase subunit beta/citryl-CoA lyase
MQDKKQLPLRRSLLATPGNVAAKVEKSLGLPVDVLMLDLEDGVPHVDAAKAAARETIAAALKSVIRQVPREVALRVNGPRTKWFLDDLRFAVEAGVRTVVIPMIDDAADQLHAHRCLDSLGAPADLGVMLLIETPASVLNLPAMIEAGPRTNGLIAGGLDYCAGLHSLAILPVGPRPLAGHEDDDLIYLRHRVLATARAYSLSALDAMRPGLLSDLEAFRADAQKARWLGFDGIDFFHPGFVDIANDVFTPSTEELQWARQLLEAASGRDPNAPASIKIDGRVMLPQHVELARRLQALAAQIGSR